MKTMIRFVFLLAFASAFCRCNVADDITSQKLEDDFVVEKAGELHNEYLDQVFEEVDFQKAMTRTDVTAAAFSSQMAASQSALLRNFPKPGMTNDQINTYIQRTLDVSIAPEIFFAAQSVVANSNYSFVAALKAKFPLSTELGGYLTEIEEIYKATLSDTSRESKRKLAFQNWYRLANADDREVISSANNVLEGSEQYWKANAAAWDVAAGKKQILTKFLKGLAISDFCSLVWAIKLAGPYALMFWKAMILAGAAGSAKAAIGCLIGAVWSVDRDGRIMVSIPGQEPILQDELRTMIYEEIMTQNQIPGMEELQK